MQGWDRFASAYGNWQTQIGRIFWREEQKQRWMKRYLCHGSFRRKLDRISNGRSLLVLTLICGLIFTFAGLMCLKDIRPDTVKNTLLLDRPFIKIRGGHPFFYKHVSKGAA